MGGLSHGIAELAGKVIGKEESSGISNALGESFRSIGARVFEQNDVGRFTKSLLVEHRRVMTQAETQLHTANPHLASHEISAQAKAVAHQQVFGQDYKALTTAYQISHAKYGPAYTQLLMDNTAMILHEDQMIAGSKHQSASKVAAYEEFAKSLQYNKKKGGEEKIPYDKTSDYHKQGPGERYVTRFIYSRFSPLIAIPHIGTAINIYQSTQNLSLAKALGDMLDSSTMAQRMQLFQASGVLAEGTMRSLRDQEAVRSGIVTQFMPGSFQDVMAKVTSTPGFHQLRNIQTKLAGTASYHDVLNYTEKFIKNPNDKLVLKRLEQYGMNPGDLMAIKRAGKMPPELLEKSVWHGVNRMIFLDTSFSRSYNANRNMWTRAMSMYHGYVSQQAKFMADEFHTAFDKDTRSIGGIAKYLTTAGVIFPVAGEALKIAEMGFRGQWSQIGPQLSDDWDELTGQKSDTTFGKIKDFMSLYLDSTAHLGAFGISYGMIQGAQRGYLIQDLMGPLLGTGAKYTQDLVRAPITGNFDAVGRDALEMSLPYGIGRFLKHKLLPTKSEIKKAKGKHGFTKLGGKSEFHLKKLNSGLN
jgi:hypothetical protein